MIFILKGIDQQRFSILFVSRHIQDPNDYYTKILWRAKRYIISEINQNRIFVPENYGRFSCCETTYLLFNSLREKRPVFLIK